MKSVRADNYEKKRYPTITKTTLILQQQQHNKRKKWNRNENQILIN